MRFTSLLASCLFITAVGSASPVAISQAGFSGSQTVVDFNTILDEQSIAAQFAGNGVTFGGPLFGMTNNGDTSGYPSNGGGVIASNWLYFGSGLQPGIITATFSSIMNRVGFYHSGNSADLFTVTFLLNGNSVGSLQGVHSGDFGPGGATFFGAEDTGGFDSVQIDSSLVHNSFFAMDDFQFEGSVATPEPSSWILIGLGAMGCLAKRGSKRLL